MSPRRMVAAVIATGAAFAILPAGQAHAEVCPTVRINAQCPDACRETLKVSGWPYVNLVVRVCT